MSTLRRLTEEYLASKEKEIEELANTLIANRETPHDDPKPQTTQNQTISLESDEVNLTVQNLHTTLGDLKVEPTIHLSPSITTPQSQVVNDFGALEKSIIAFMGVMQKQIEILERVLSRLETLKIPQPEVTVTPHLKITPTKPITFRIEESKGVKRIIPEE